MNRPKNSGDLSTMDSHTAADGNQLNTGYFLFSLDTELAWGYFDLDDIRSRKFAADGAAERRSIKRLLDILDEFNITATWALVGHLFYDKCEKCSICPILEWQGKYRSFEEVYETNHPLWYGKDIVELLLARGSRHEIAFHAYTHRVFDSRMTQQDARIEIQEWLRAAKTMNLVPRTVIFPRNRVGHLDAFEEAGFICYRGEQVMPKTYAIPLIGKTLNRIDLVLQIFSPQAYELRTEAAGLVNLPSSRWLFGMNRNVELILDALNLHNLRIRAFIKEVERAAREKKVIHIWAHPYEFRTEKDFAKLHYLLSHVAERVAEGSLQSVGMAELARMSGAAIRA
jgi:hypothetical protein